MSAIRGYTPAPDSNPTPNTKKICLNIKMAMQC